MTKQPSHRSLPECRFFLLQPLPQRKPQNILHHIFSMTHRVLVPPLRLPPERTSRSQTIHPISLGISATPAVPLPDSISCFCKETAPNPFKRYRLSCENYNKLHINIHSISTHTHKTHHALVCKMLTHTSPPNGSMRLAAPSPCYRQGN